MSRPTATNSLRVERSDTAAGFMTAAAAEMDRGYRLAGLILGSATEAEDAVQDALLIAWRSYGSLREPSAFPAWFDRILVNTCRDRLRRRRVVRFVPLEDAATAELGDPFAAMLARDTLLRPLATLPFDERTVVILHYWADLPLDGVAARLGRPVGTVESVLHRALTHMRSAARDGEVPT